jgi:hypothetical protein
MVSTASRRKRVASRVRPTHNGRGWLNRGH